MPLLPPPVLLVSLEEANIRWGITSTSVFFVAEAAIIIIVVARGVGEGGGIFQLVDFGTSRGRNGGREEEGHVSQQKIEGTDRINMARYTAAAADVWH